MRSREERSQFFDTNIGPDSGLMQEDDMYASYDKVGIEITSVLGLCIYALPNKVWSEPYRRMVHFIQRCFGADYQDCQITISLIDQDCQKFGMDCHVFTFPKPQQSSKKSEQFTKMS